ncbi:ANTAR domain-containing protein [Streptomyces sp. NPDC055060]
MSTDTNTSATSIESSGAGEVENAWELQEEVEQLRHAVWAHAIVDQAIGVVVALGRLDPDAAWNVIRTVSMHTNTKVRDVAQQILAFVAEGDLDRNLHRELKRQIQQHQERSAAADPTSEE